MTLMHILLIDAVLAGFAEKYYSSDFGVMIHSNENWLMTNFDQQTKLLIYLIDNQDVDISVSPNFYEQEIQLIQKISEEVHFEKITHQLYLNKYETFQFSFQKQISNEQQIHIQLFSDNKNAVLGKLMVFEKIVQNISQSRKPASTVNDVKTRVGEMICENGIFQKQVRSLLNQSEELLKAGCQSYAKQNGLQKIGNTALGCLKGGGSLVKDVVQLAYELINFLYKSSLSSKYQKQVSEKFADLLKLAAAHPKEFLQQVYGQLVDLVSREMESIANCGPEYQARMACKVLLSILSGHFLFKSATVTTVVADETTQIANWGARQATKSESAFSPNPWYRSQYRSALDVPGFKRTKSEISEKLNKLFKTQDPNESIVREQLFRTNYLNRIKDPTIRETTEAVYQKMNDPKKFSQYIDQLVDDAAHEMYSANDFRKLQKLENGEIEPWAYAKVLMKRAKQNGLQVNGVKKFDLEEFFQAVEKSPFIDLTHKNNLHGMFTHMMQQDYVSDVVKTGMKGRPQDYYQSLVRQSGARLWDTIFDSTELSISGKTPMAPEWLNRDVLVKILKFQKITN